MAKHGQLSPEFHLDLGRRPVGMPISYAGEHPTSRDVEEPCADDEFEPGRDTLGRVRPVASDCPLQLGIGQVGTGHGYEALRVAESHTM